MPLRYRGCWQNYQALLHTLCEMWLAIRNSLQVRNLTSAILNRQFLSRQQTSVAGMVTDTDMIEVLHSRNGLVFDEVPQWLSVSTWEAPYPAKFLACNVIKLDLGTISATYFDWCEVGYSANTNHRIGCAAQHRMLGWNGIYTTARLHTQVNLKNNNNNGYGLALLLPTLSLSGTYMHILGEHVWFCSCWKEHSKKMSNFALIS